MPLLKKDVKACHVTSYYRHTCLFGDQLYLFCRRTRVVVDKILHSGIAYCNGQKEGRIAPGDPRIHQRDVRLRTRYGQHHGIIGMATRKRQPEPGISLRTSGSPLRDHAGKIPKASVARPDGCGFTDKQVASPDIRYIGSMETRTHRLHVQTGAVSRTNK